MATICNLLKISGKFSKRREFYSAFLYLYLIKNVFMATGEKCLTVNENPKDNVYYVAYNSTSFDEAYQAYYDYGSELVLRYTNAQSMNFVLRMTFLNEYVSSGSDYRRFYFDGFLLSYSTIYYARTSLSEYDGWAPMAVNSITVDADKEVSAVTISNYNNGLYLPTVSAVTSYFDTYCHRQTLQYNTYLTFCDGSIIRTTTGASVFSMTLNTFAEYFLRSMGAYPIDFAQWAETTKYTYLQRFAPSISFFTYDSTSIGRQYRAPAYFLFSNDSMKVSDSASDNCYVSANGTSVSIKLL